jgi:hypothetical protein
MKLSTLAAAVAALAATASFASIPPAYQKHLPPERVQGDVEFLTGGRTPEERAAVKRAAQEWPLEIVFYERDGPRQRTVENMPVTITDESGKVVFDGIASGPVMLVKLPPGRYTVNTKWDAWEFSKPVTLGDERERVVFQWKREDIPVA